MGQEREERQGRLGAWRRQPGLVGRLLEQAGVEVVWTEMMGRQAVDPGVGCRSLEQAGLEAGCEAVKMNL